MQQTCQMKPLVQQEHRSAVAIPVNHVPARCGSVVSFRPRLVVGQWVSQQQPHHGMCWLATPGYPAAAGTSMHRRHQTSRWEPTSSSNSPALLWDLWGCFSCTCTFSCPQLSSPPSNPPPAEELHTSCGVISPTQSSSEQEHVGRVYLAAAELTQLCAFLKFGTTAFYVLGVVV